MRIEILISKPFEVNSYLILGKGEVIIIDPFEAEKVLREIKNYKLKYILLTHGHIDHISAVNKIKKETGAKIGIHKGDSSLLVNSKDNLAKKFGLKFKSIKEDFFLEDEQILNFENKKIKVIHTPGHTKGSVCFLLDKILFSGDTLFKGSIGRVDLPGGNLEQEISSIKNKIFKLDDKIKILPGHGESTTISEEKINNQFLN